MTWTAKPPTEPDWYRWRFNSASPIMWVQIIRAGDRLIDTNGGMPVVSIGGEWWDEPLRLPWEDKP